MPHTAADSVTISRASTMLRVARYACQASFRGKTRGNAVPIVKLFKNALWTVLRTILRPKMHQIAGFCTHSLNVFRDTPGHCPAAEGAVLRTRPIVSLGSPAFSLLLFYDTTIGACLFPVYVDDKLHCFLVPDRPICARTTTQGRTRHRRGWNWTRDLQSEVQRLSHCATEQHRPSRLVW